MKARCSNRNGSGPQVSGPEPPNQAAGWSISYRLMSSMGAPLIQSSYSRGGSVLRLHAHFRRSRYVKKANQAVESRDVDYSGAIEAASLARIVPHLEPVVLSLRVPSSARRKVFSSALFSTRHGALAALPCWRTARHQDANIQCEGAFRPINECTATFPSIDVSGVRLRRHWAEPGGQQPRDLQIDGSGLRHR